MIDKIRLAFIIFGSCGLLFSSIITIFLWLTSSRQSVFYAVLSWVFFFILALGFTEDKTSQFKEKSDNE